MARHMRVGKKPTPVVRCATHAVTAGVIDRVDHARATSVTSRLYSTVIVTGSAQLFLSGV